MFRAERWKKCTKFLIFPIALVSRSGRGTITAHCRQNRILKCRLLSISFYLGTLQPTPTSGYMNSIMWIITNGSAHGKSPENKPGNKLPKHYLKQHLKQSITNKEERNQVCALLCFQYIEGLFQNNIMRLQKNNQSSLTDV